MKKIQWDFYEKRPIGQAVEHLVIHSFAFPIPKILSLWQNMGVGPHYLIDSDGCITQFVSEDNVAYHAGKSFWRGQERLNLSSVGIELYSPSFGQEPYPKKQLDALVELAGDIIVRHHIRPIHVVGHSDIAPTRKVDPGVAFPWAGLANVGIGLYPLETASVPQGSVSELLSVIGYDVSDAKAALYAFKRRFMPELIQKDDDIVNMESNLFNYIQADAQATDLVLQRLGQVAGCYEDNK